MGFVPLIMQIRTKRCKSMIKLKCNTGHGEFPVSNHINKPAFFYFQNQRFYVAWENKNTFSFAWENNNRYFYTCGNKPNDFFLPEKTKTYFLFLVKQNQIYFHFRNQTKGLFFTWENKTSFSFAWVTKYIYIYILL